MYFGILRDHIDSSAMKLCSISYEILTIEYCLRQLNYVLVSSHLKIQKFGGSKVPDSQ